MCKMPSINWGEVEISPATIKVDRLVIANKTSIFIVCNPYLQDNVVAHRYNHILKPVHRLFEAIVHAAARIALYREALLHSLYSHNVLYIYHVVKLK